MDLPIDESYEPVAEVRACVTLWLAGDELEACLRIAQLPSDQRAHFAGYALRQVVDVLNVAAAGAGCTPAELWQRLRILDAQRADVT